MAMAFDAETEVSDEALLVAYGNGDREAAAMLTARLAPAGAWGFAARMLGGDRAEAEDVTQEAMLRLWKIAPEWRQGEAKVTTWLYRVSTNLCTDRLRKRRVGRHRRDPGAGRRHAGGGRDHDRGRPGPGAGAGAGANCPSGNGWR